MEISFFAPNVTYGREIRRSISLPHASVRQGSITSVLRRCENMPAILTTEKVWASGTVCLFCRKKNSCISSARVLHELPRTNCEAELQYASPYSLNQQTNIDELQLVSMRCFHSIRKQVDVYDKEWTRKSGLGDHVVETPITQSHESEADLLDDDDFFELDYELRYDSLNFY